MVWVGTLLFWGCCWLGEQPTAAVHQRVTCEAAGQLGEAVEIDKDKIRYGDLSKFDPKNNDKVGTVRSKDVYERIPAYKKIKEENVEKDSARWNQLMKEATDVYKKALKTVATDGDYKLIIEEGGVKGYSTTDLTDKLIEQVPSTSLKA